MHFERVYIALDIYGADSRVGTFDSQKACRPAFFKNATGPVPYFLVWQGVGLVKKQHAAPQTIV